MTVEQALRMSHGDVDADGEIVDRVERLLSAIGPDRAAGITKESQLELIRSLIARELDLAHALLVRARAVAT